MLDAPSYGEGVIPKVSERTQQEKHHLVNSCVALYVHQLWYADGASLANTAQVVSDEVDDHKILGHVFLPLGKVGGKDEVFGRSLAPGEFGREYLGARGMGCESGRAGAGAGARNREGKGYKG